MRVTKYILALMVGSLVLLTGARLDLAAGRAESTPKAIEHSKRAPSPKQKLKRPIQLDLKAIVMPEPISTVAVLATPRAHTPPAKKGPYIDIEGLVVGDLHVQPNLLFNTDTRYDNSSTRERAQRDDQDFMSARQHGDSTRGPDPVGELIKTKLLAPANSPLSNDPGFEVATSVRDQLNVLPPKLVMASAPAATPPTSAVSRKPVAKLAKL